MTGEELIQWRETHVPRIPRRRAAEMLGVTESTVHRWETGVLEVPHWVPWRIELLQMKDEVDTRDMRTERYRMICPHCGYNEGMANIGDYDPSKSGEG